MNIPFVDLKAQYHSIRDEIDAAISSVIEETSFIGGKHVKKFEEEFAAYLGVKHCIGVGNGTDALAIALRGIGLNPGDEVVVPANTFIGTAEAVTLAGGKPIFADCDPITYTITPETVEKAITPKTKGIIPVHLYGNAAPIGELKELAERKGLFLLEDAAQAHGVTYKEGKIGSFGRAATFSFYPGKNLGAYGDGGCIATNDSELATRIRMYANHGRIKKYDHEFEGTNSRLDGIQAAILSVKLKYLDDWTEKRRTVAQLYTEKLAGLPLATPSETPGSRHVYHLYVIRLQNRDKIKEILSQEGITTGVHYPEALPNLTAYKHLGHKPEDFPFASRCSKEVLSLPIFPEMTIEQVETVCEALKTALSKA